MDFGPVTRIAFAEELEKICSSMSTLPKAREGRRPVSVDTLLKKDKEGTLYKESEDMLQKVLRVFDNRMKKPVTAPSREDGGDPSDSKPSNAALTAY